jgi:hypothetical protein
MEWRCSNRDCAREGAIVQKELGSNYTDFLNVEVSNVILGTSWGPGNFLDIIHMPMPASKALQKVCFAIKKPFSSSWLPKCLWHRNFVTRLGSDQRDQPFRGTTLKADWLRRADLDTSDAAVMTRKT